MAEIQELKEKAIAYYQENRVPLRMQDVLNIMFQENPKDVNGFVSRYFEELAAIPTVTKLHAFRSIDNKGFPALSMKVFCMVRNKETCMSQVQVTIDTNLVENAKPEERDEEEAQRAAFIDKAIEIINSRFSNLLASLDPQQQQEIDNKIYALIEKERQEIEAREGALVATEETNAAQPADDSSKKGGKKSGKNSAKKKGAQIVITPDNPKETPYTGWEAVTATSQAVCLAAASIQHTPAFNHLLSAYGYDELPIRLPIPMITLIQSGKSALGKSNCVKEFMVVPRCDMSITDAINYAVKIHDGILKVLSAKSGVSVRNLSDSGALCPLLDKPEQGLDLINDAVVQLGLEMGKDFYYMLNVSAPEFFDYEKGKYEVMGGVVKSPDDMADFWLDLISRYPAISGLIDPLRSEEKEQWNKISSAISDKCLVIADRAFARPGLLKDQQLDVADFASSGIVMRLEKSNTITHIMECSEKLRAMDNVVILATGQHDTCDTVINDLAIACQARFVKLGALSRGERIIKYNQLMNYEAEYQDKLAQWQPLELKVIPPVPPPEESTDEPAVNGNDQET